MIVGILDIAR